MSIELNAHLHSEITARCGIGDEFTAKGEFVEAIRCYSEAWALLPEPKLQWEAALWIQSALGDVYYLTHNYAVALEAFSLAVQCPGGLGNPFIHLRLGECHFEVGNHDKAKDELTRAFMGAGREIFANEHPKYFELLKSVLKPPVGQREL